MIDDAMLDEWEMPLPPPGGTFVSVNGEWVEVDGDDTPD